MTFVSDSFDTLPQMPSWITSGRAETLEDVAFLSGAALNHLHLVLKRQDVPQTLLRERLALCASEACVAHSGRSERAADLRDAIGFLLPGDSPGPAGEIYSAWRRAIGRVISVKSLHLALPDVEAAQLVEWLDVGRRGTVARATSVLSTVSHERPRDFATALILAEASLAQTLGWSYMVPLLSLGLHRNDLRKTGEDLQFAAHRAIAKAATEATREAAVLERRAVGLKDVAPKLRAKGADRAVDLFLSQDAVAPSALTSLRSDRAARRFCDRLVELGAVRELTGRDTFRLYGV
ncbi:DUF1403 family protein [Phaeobacter gallaeciensis]|uniref:DUF1403 family protein n=1 Tax=Phaeobacter gallaeciensis TaxID=60890 RepID=A0ABD4XEF9_9RHOB|nr:DUF1403 family protein [Phaeobacter gallaeciensis]MDE4142136.1 DUF1403 family protein [Phaeobacter gallaeciensis]MDE4146550.1 DUF1403 family protein [Phaeobacter gallaeciensis]MDE4150623.1 DUF1403 family protein [Phaeobacter gallaeciensis]MDE4154801.1 DUF1403 family protein [Phaeobacter gallaeciensis]MDE4159309.1 DUF1403 family protein [Phaeobacter gallaeciensis]